MPGEVRGYLQEHAAQRRCSPDSGRSATQPDSGIEITVYDGLTVTVTSALGQTQERRSNVIGHLVEVTDHLGTSIEYAYDAVGNLVEAVAGSIPAAPTT